MTWQRGARSAGDRGAIVMLIAILAGTGALAALVAIGVDLGRFYAAREAVAHSARSDAEALGQQCLGSTNVVRGAYCASAQSLYNLANSAALQEGSVHAVVAVCVDTGTGNSCYPNTPAASAAAAARCIPLSAPYVSVVLQATQAVQPFLPVGSAKTYSDCGQATWSKGQTFAVPKVLLLPACQFTPGTPAIVMYENPGGGSSSSLNPPSTGGCPHTGSGTNAVYSSLNMGGSLTLQPDKTWIDEIGQITTDTSCVGTSLLNLNNTRAASDSILGSGACTPANIEAYFNDTATAGTHKRMMALGGSLGSNNYVQIAAFAAFTMTSFFDGTSNVWRTPNGVATSTPTLSGSLPSGSCSGSGGKFCLYGVFDNAVAAGYGTGVPSLTIKQ